MRPARQLAVVAAAAAGLWLAVPAAASPTTVTARGGLAPNTVAQIDALAQAKLGRSPAQRKISSRLLTEATMRSGRPLAAGVSRVSTGVSVDKNGLTTVDVTGTVTSALLGNVSALGGRVLGSYPGYGVIRAAVPLTSIEALAAVPYVAHVAVADQPITARMGPGPKPMTKEQRLEQVRQRVKAALAAAAARPRTSGAVTPFAGAATSEGDVTHAADRARARFHVSGIGVKVGVLSDGVASLAASIASGDLPPDTQVLPGQAGTGDEGTAMMEIVHDLAPKASLEFATAIGGQAQFAQNIRDLRAAGCKIIVDDVIYYAESPFQDGIVAQAVIDVTRRGTLYFSSAGNQQNVDDHTAGNWEGDYVPSGQTIGKFAGIAHDFNPGRGVQAVNRVSEDSAGQPAILQWNDPLGRSGNDYDLYETDTAGNVVAFSNDVQNGNDDPFEGFFMPFVSGGGRLAVVKFRGADRYFQLTPFGGRFESGGGLVGYNTPGVTRGHSAVPAAFSVAAAPAHDAFPREIAPGVPNPSGPYPGVFTSAQKSETFTSDGPRHVFYNPDGSPITPGNLTSTGGRTRRKPDITAADGVVTTVPGFERFYGTSAAAPHAAAIAALILSGNPGITPTEVRAALTRTAIDIEKPGHDRDTGFGIVMANRALRFTGATPQPFVRAGDPTVTPVTGDGDQFFEAGETADVAVPATNIGDGTARSVNVQVTTSTRGVTITPTVRRYGTVAVGATATRSFRFALAANYPNGQPVAVHVKVSFVGAYSPQSRDIKLPTGQPTNTITDIAYTGPAVPIPDNSTVGADVTLPVAPGFGRLSQITFSVDGTSCDTTEGSTTVGIDHTFVADLVGTLVAPDGTRVVLFANSGGSGNNICQAVFTDAATRSFQDAVSGDAPFTASWKPAQPLNALIGSLADGTWIFHVEDTAAADTGNIRAVSMHISGYVR